MVEKWPHEGRKLKGAGDMDDAGNKGLDEHAELVGCGEEGGLADAPSGKCGWKWPRPVRAAVLARRRAVHGHGRRQSWSSACRRNEHCFRVPRHQLRKPGRLPAIQRTRGGSRRPALRQPRPRPNRVWDIRGREYRSGRGGVPAAFGGGEGLGGGEGFGGAGGVAKYRGC